MQKNFANANLCDPTICTSNGNNQEFAWLLESNHVEYFIVFNVELKFTVGTILGFCIAFKFINIYEQ